MLNKRIRNVVIELTSLLDVVMILIFAVMIENSKLAIELQGKLDAAESEIESMQEENSGLSNQLQNAQEQLSEIGDSDLEALLERLSKDESQLESYSQLNETLTIINISLENKVSGNRDLVYGCGDSSTYVKIPRDDDAKWQDEINKFRVFLDDNMKNIPAETNSKAVCIILSVDNNKIYSRNYDDIVKAIEDIKKKNSGLTIYTNY